MEGAEVMLTRLSDDGIGWVEDLVAPKPTKAKTSKKAKEDADADEEDEEGEFWDDLDHESCGYGPIDDARATDAGQAIEASLFEFREVLNNGAADATERRAVFDVVYAQIVELANAFGRGPEHGPQQFCDIDFDKDAWFEATAYTKCIVLLHFKTNSLGLKHLKELVSYDGGRTHEAKSVCWNMIREYCGDDLFDNELAIWNRVVYAAHGSADANSSQARKGIRLTTNEMREHLAFKYFDIAHDIIINVLRPQCIVTFGSRDSERFQRGHERCHLPEFIMVDDNGNDRTFTAAAHPAYLLRYAFAYSQTTADAGHFATAGVAFGMIMDDPGEGFFAGKRLKDDMSKMHGVTIEGEFRPWTVEERAERILESRRRWLSRENMHNALGWTNGQCMDGSKRFEGNRLDLGCALRWTPLNLRNARRRFENHQLNLDCALRWTPVNLRNARRRFENHQLNLDCALRWTPVNLQNARQRFERRRLDLDCALRWTPSNLQNARDRFEGNRLDLDCALRWTPENLQNARRRFEDNRLDLDCALRWTRMNLRNARRRFERRRLDLDCALCWTRMNLQNARERFERRQLDLDCALRWTPVNLRNARQRFERRRLDLDCALRWTPSNLESARKRFERHRLDLDCALRWTPVNLQNARKRFDRARKRLTRR